MRVLKHTIYYYFSPRGSIFPLIPTIEQRLEFFFDCLVLYESFGVEGDRLSVSFKLSPTAEESGWLSVRLHLAEVVVGSTSTASMKFKQWLKNCFSLPGSVRLLRCGEG